MTIVLTDAGATDIAAATASGDDLWLARSDVDRATGWTMKPEGLCRGEVCVPVPQTADTYVKNDKINVAAFWRLLGRPVLHDSAGATWMLGAAATDRARALQSLTAPDFRLPDCDGKHHSLSDYRDKRVLLTTWSSW